MSQRVYDELYGDAAQASKEDSFPSPELLMERLSRFAMDRPELSRAWLFDVMTTQGEVTDKFWQKYVSRLQEYVDAAWYGCIVIFGTDTRQGRNAVGELKPYTQAVRVGLFGPNPDRQDEAR